jgi:hypothetical protein
MPMDRFLIAPLSEGLETDVKPWLLPDKAFALLKNAYLFRGSVRKRFGTRLLQGTSAVDPDVAQIGSRLRELIDTTDGSGNASGTVNGAVFKVGQMFSVGDEIFTVTVTGTPGVMLTTGAATTHTYNTTTGAYDIQGAAATTDVYFYPAEPVMGLLTYELSTINDEITYAFDTQFAYTYTSGGWERLGTGIWTGDDSQFFWGENYRGADAEDSLLFVTNYNAADLMWYWDGATWTQFSPAYDVAGNTIDSCRVILSFKDHLLLLNTIEDNGTTVETHGNRCRYSQSGSPVAADAFYEAPETSGKGGVIDAPTKEQIISARILRDRAIVFFERSTWELVYTGNKILPFLWQKINSELGAESTFSTVLFDKVLLGVGNVGIHACNGANVERIDEKIPDFVFDIHNGSDGPERVYGIRDYKAEVVYWTLPGSENNPTYPTQVLVYNYRTGGWALNDDSLTCFGTIQNESDETWQSIQTTWSEMVSMWDSGSLQSEFPSIAAGNQQGYVFIVDQNVTRNAPSLQVSALSIGASNVVTLTVVDHNLQIGDYILVESVQGTTGINDSVYSVTSASGDDITITVPGVGGTYTGGGTLARVSQIDIKTKEYNFYQKEGRNLFIPKIDFYVDRTSNGQIAVDFSPSSSDRSMVSDGTTTGAILGSSILETSPHALIPLESSQERFWHALYPQAEGSTIQFRIYLSETQMLDKDIALSDFQLNGFCIYSQSVSRF